MLPLVLLGRLPRASKLARKVVQLPAILAELLMVAPMAGQSPPGCTGSSSLGTFRILVRRAAGGAALPVKSVSVFSAGSHLIWEPVHLPPNQAETAAPYTCIRSAISTVSTWLPNRAIN